MIFADAATPAAGPHASGSPEHRIHRLHFNGTDVLTWVVHRHPTIASLLGVAVIGARLRRPRRSGPTDALELLTILGVLMVTQGLIGSVQYELRLPREIV